MDNDFLFSEFAPVSKETWKKQALTELGGQPYEKIIWKIGGLDIEPYYTQEECQLSENMLINRESAAWRVRQDFETTAGYADTNRMIHAALRYGVDDVGISFSAACTPDDIDRLFEGLSPERTAFHLMAGTHYESVLNSYMVWMGRQTYVSRALHGSLEGSYQYEQSDSTLKQLLSVTSAVLPYYKILSITLPSIDYDCNDMAEELAIALLQAERLFSRLIRISVDPNRFAQIVQWRVEIGPLFFLEIARLRAIRWMWQHWLEHHRLARTSAYIQAYKSWKHHSADMPHQNILLHTTEAMSAVIGGCDVLCLKSTDFDERFDTAFYERINVNIQHLLRYEAYFDKIVDPAAGSYYLETITRRWCDMGWERFLKKLSSSD